MKRNLTLQITTAAFCVAINIVGSFLASSLHLPIYLDSIGTIFAGFLMGPLFGMAVGCLGNAVSGILFDVYSLYFMPVSIVLGLTAGLLYGKTRFLNKFWIPLGVLFLIIPESIVGTVINTVMFGGVTTSGSSIFVILLRRLGLSVAESAFIIQILFDYLDRFISVFLVTVVIFQLRVGFKNKLKGWRQRA